jgi:hypothetical protein
MLVQTGQTADLVGMQVVVVEQAQQESKASKVGVADKGVGGSLAILLALE